MNIRLLPFLALSVACPIAGAETPMDYPRTAGPAAEPMDLRAGHEAFVTRCGLCHAVRGSPARGIAGPDLTHLMSRKWIGAGLLPNTVGNLGGWVANAQAQKPGCAMPAMELPGAELQAVLGYLRTLR